MVMEEGLSGNFSFILTFSSGILFLSLVCVCSVVVVDLRR